MKDVWEVFVANGYLTPIVTMVLLLDAIAVYAILLDGVYKFLHLKKNKKQPTQTSECERLGAGKNILSSATLAEILAKTGMAGGVIFAIPEFTLATLSEQSAIPGFFLLSATAALLPAFALAAALRLGANMADVRY